MKVSVGKKRNMEFMDNLLTLNFTAENDTIDTCMLHYGGFENVEIDYYDALHACKALAKMRGAKVLEGATFVEVRDFNSAFRIADEYVCIQYKDSFLELHPKGDIDTLIGEVISLFEAVVAIWDTLIEETTQKGYWKV